MKYFAIGLAALVCASAGCKDETDRPAADDRVVDVDVNEEQLRQEREEFVREARQRMEKIQAEMAQLNRQLDEQGEATRGEIRESLRALEREREALYERLRAMSAQTREQWNEFRTDTQQALDRIEREYNALMERMKTEPTAPTQPGDSATPTPPATE